MDGKVSLFNDRHLELLYGKIYDPSRYFSARPLSELKEDLDWLCDGLVRVFALLRKGHKPNSSLVSRELTGNFLSQFRGSLTRAEFEHRLSGELSAFLQFCLHYGTLLSAVCEYSGIDPSSPNKFMTYVDEFRDSFQQATGTPIPLTLQPKSVSSDLISEVIGAVLRAKRMEFSETDDALTDLRYKNHTCPTCRFRPAVYFAEPCLHPSFCLGCMKELADHGGVFTHCFICKAKVDSVHPLLYLSND
jgi:hypothetical protein